jgi:O-6-methylguanine DNA methyltransferase
MVAGSTPAGLCMLEFADRPTLSAQVRALAQSLGGGVAARPGALGDALTSQIDSYFSSSLRAFTLPLQMIGTPFQVRAWQALTHIPYGTRRAYGEQAAAVGNPRAVRAVARANGQNPIAIVVPCHRVVGADGSLTGYGGGVERKQRLLDLEGGVRNLFAVG